MSRNLLLEVTPDIIANAQTMIREARHAALAVIEVESGFPAVSRAGIATLEDGKPILLTSALAAHTGALAADGRCSLLIGTIGKGDVMAHGRITLFCRAAPVAEVDVAGARARYLSHHPKARLYVDLPDFGFWKLSIERASFNGGFGKAWALEGEDLAG